MEVYCARGTGGVSLGLLGGTGCVAGLQPPAPLPEVRYAAPAPNMTWVDGSWHWTGAAFTWLPGRWESTPPTP